MGIASSFDLIFRVSWENPQHCKEFYLILVNFHKTCPIYSTLLVIDDFIFSKGLFSPSFARVDEKFKYFSRLLVLNWEDLKSILNNISSCRKVSKFKEDTQ